MARLHWRRCLCWFRDHDYVVQQVGLDPKAPLSSANIIAYMAFSLGGPVGVRKCRRCWLIDEHVALEDDQTMKFCYDCLDRIDGPVRIVYRRTTYGEVCDGCKRIEADNPKPSE